ncbi:hypothetical protein HNY73_015398 [Argiope bruennichi]|uniref:Uncharacterized protein n=1 Tax=Argiope bruennichi TaxID=94029 RepID=A0A8T0ES70_ARGBR|nr:hypothetical protein HNY73_015398 [Argiope bruennichi]
MSLLKAFVCQVILLGTYKLFLEHIFDDYLIPDELTRNCFVGFVCLLCFGIQLYTEKVEDQTGHAEPSKAKSDRRKTSDTPDTFSEFLDARTAHMMRTLDQAMQQMSQMPMSDGYVQNVIFAAAGPEAAVIEQAFVKQPDVVVVEEIHVTKLDDAIYANDKSDIFATEPIVIPVKVEEIEEKQNVSNETEEEKQEKVEEETETKSDVCEEEEEDVYTDKAADEDFDEAEEDLKATSNSREAASTKKCESAEISATRETIGSNTASQGMVTKTQTTSQEIGGISFSTAKDQITDSKEKISAIPKFDTVKAPPVTNAGIFSQFSTNMHDSTPSVKANETKVFASNVQTSYKQETTTISASNGLSETIVCEESDEDEIEIDQFETKQSVKEAESLVSTKLVPEPVTDIAVESECLISNGENISSTQDLEITNLKTDESETEITDESEAEIVNGTVETTNLKTDESEAEIVNGTVETTNLKTDESEAEIVNGTVETTNLKTDESEAEIVNGAVETTNLKTDESEAEIVNGTFETTNLKTDESEAEIVNGTVEDSLNNNIDSISLSKIEETESKTSVKDENKIGNRQEISLVSEPGESTKDTTESLPSTEEVKKTSSVLTKAINAAEITNKNNAETPTLVKSAVSSTISKIKASGDVCVAPVTIDISFIYACH